MAEKTLEQMREELDKAGYEFLSEHFAGMSFDDFTGWVLAPDGTWIEGESFGYKMQSGWQEAKRKADESCIEKAWQHYQREKQHEAMREFVNEMANLDEMIGADWPASKVWLAQSMMWLAWKEKAKALLESMK